MRILALDLGDVWVGTAVSDALGLTCRPLQTVKRKDLIVFLKETIPALSIGKVLLGLPAGSHGQDTEQTKKTRAFFDDCRVRFAAVEWELFDEFLTSKIAVDHQRDVKKQKLSVQSKHESHSLAAAFLLRDYLVRPRPGALDEIDIGD